MVTITDIAAALGVTPSTVSRALSGSPRVKQETRQAVLKAAREMGYEHNVVASNLRRGKSNIVGIIVPRIYREFFSNVIGGAESILHEAGYNVLICQNHEDKDAELQAIHALRKNQVACIMMSHAFDTVDPEPIAEALGDTPLVQFDRVFHSLPGAKVVNDNFHSAYMATRHLIDNGYRRIGTLAGNESCDAYKDRYLGYRKALEDCGLEYDDEIVFREVIVRETGYAAGLKAIDLGCDALYSAGDFSALGAMEAVKSRGLRIPDQFGLVGTADETFASLTYPSLSSLSQHAYEMGQAMANSFLNCSQETTLIPMELNVRESSSKSRITKDYTHA